MLDSERILDKLNRLREADQELNVFGADTHQYRLNAPLTEDDVLRFEREHGLSLPSDYRQFLRHVGNGGVGPYYGLYSLADAVESDDPGFLARPFPHRHWWNGCDPPNWFDLPDAHLATPTAESEAAYFASEHVQGSLRLAHEGCGYHRILVVSGPERGTVWSDERASDGGITPMPYANGPFHVEGHYLIPDDGELPRTSFLQWYEEWLDTSLAQVS